MKKLYLLVAFIGSFIITQTAQANSVGLLVGLYNSVSNQLSIVSNTPPVDSKLAKSLNAALSTIQKSGGGTDLVSAVKGLGTVVTTVNRTSVSNALYLEVKATLLSCVAGYASIGHTYSNQVAGLFPSAARTSVLNGVSNLLATLSNISSMPNMATAVKALSGVSKQLTTIQKAVPGAQGAPAPAASVTATVVISGSPNFSFKAQQTVAQHTAGGNFLVNSLQTVVSGASGTLHSLAFGIYGLAPGANIVSGSDGEYSRAGTGTGAGAFSITSSSVHANWDPTHKLISGTFSFNLQEEGGSRTGSVTGSFSVYYP